MSTDPNEPASREKDDLTSLRKKVYGELERIERLVSQLAKRSDQESSEKEKSQYLKIAEFFISQGNKARSSREILKGARVTRSSLSQILHRTHSQSFESILMPGYSRKKRMKRSEFLIFDDASELGG